MNRWIALACLSAAIVLFALADRGWTRPAAHVPEPEVEADVEGEAAGEDLSYAPDEWPEAPDMAAMLKRLVAGTSVVLALCVGLLLAGKRWLSGAPTRAGSNTMLRRVETLALGNRCSIHLLQTGEHQILVGIDPGGIKSLIPLPPAFEGALAAVPSGEIETHETFAAAEPEFSAVESEIS